MEWFDKGGGRWTKEAPKGKAGKTGNGKGKGGPKPEPKPDKDKAKGNGKQTEAKVPTIVEGYDITKTFPVDTGGVWTW